MVPVGSEFVIRLARIPVHYRASNHNSKKNQVKEGAMQKKLLKKLVCVSGLLFMAFPAWSAVPSNLFAVDGGWSESMVTAVAA